MADCANVINQILKSPQSCVGTWRTQSDSACGANDSILANQYLVETLEISGAPINIFKLLGVHEQGSLVDLTGNGRPMASGTQVGASPLNPFQNSTTASWISLNTGSSVTLSPAFIGYDFGTKKSVTGGEKYAPSQPKFFKISSFKIQQSSVETRRATQVRIDRSDGDCVIQNIATTFGAGSPFSHIVSGKSPIPSDYRLIPISSSQFQVYNGLGNMLGLAQIGVPFYSLEVNFVLSPSLPSFTLSDYISFSTVLNWKRVDVVNLPNDGNFNLVSFKHSVPSRFWRIVPTIFSGVATNDPWEVVRLSLMEYTATDLSNIQDTLFLENRDRAYAQTSVMLRCSFQPSDPQGDLGKFGFAMFDQYTFTCAFSSMVELLGRPIVIGDVIEVCPEGNFDQNMNYVKKYLEVTDAGWAGDGYTAGWTPLVYRFSGTPLLPSQEHRDIIKTVTKQKFNIDDPTFFLNNPSIVTENLTISEDIGVQASDKVPETGSDGGTELASGMSNMSHKGELNVRGSYDGTDPYIEDGLPPNGEPYTEGYVLPDLDSTPDGAYFRLNYPPESKIPARLYKFSAYKRRWIFVESDKRMAYSSIKPSLNNMLSSSTRESIKGTK